MPMWDLQAASFHAGVGLSNRVQSAHRGLGQNVNHLSFCSGLRADVSWFMKEWSNLEFSLRVHPALLLLPVLVQFLIALGLFLTHTVTLEWGHDYLSVQIYIDWSNCPPSICCHPHLFLALLMNNLSNIKQWYLASRSAECWITIGNDPVQWITITMIWCVTIVTIATIVTIVTIRREQSCE